MPLTWPNLQDGNCKNSIQIEFQVGPECGNKSSFGMNIGYFDSGTSKTVVGILIHTWLNIFILFSTSGKIKHILTHCGNFEIKPSLL